MDSSKDAAKDSKKQYLEVEALRGFGKSGARISSIMNEMQAKKLLEKTQSSTVTRDSTSAHKGEKKQSAVNVNEDILNKVEGLIQTKKKPEKVYNNNPPKKEAP